MNARAKVWTAPPRWRRLALWLPLAACLATRPARAFNVFDLDVLRTAHSIAPTASGTLIDANRTGLCVFGALGNPLRLSEAVERALCNSAKTREAWAQVKVQAAQVGIAKSAYLPTLSATGQTVRDDSWTDVAGHPQLSSANRSTVRSGSVSANWVLWDFGGRRAATDSAVDLFAAAKATQSAALQETFATVAKDYYAAQAAQGGLAAALEAERVAHDSEIAAVARVDHGVAPISDELQAQTAYAQATYARAKAAGDLKVALGTLAADMNLMPTDTIGLPPVADGVQPGEEVDASIDDLMDEAKRDHPSVLAAQAQLEASQAKTRELRAEGLPTISVTAKYSTNNQPASLGLGIPQFPATGHDWYVGIQVTIPLFEGFNRTYQVREAEAQSEVRDATLAEIRQQVALDVWTSYQTLKTGEENLTNTQTLLTVAVKSLNAAKQRYQAGVGNILELLNAQSAVADAAKQRIHALTDWRNERLQLSGKLGRLDMHDVDMQ